MPEHYTRQQGLWATAVCSVEEPPLLKPKSHKAHLHTQHGATTWGKDPWDRVLTGDAVAILADTSMHAQGIRHFPSPAFS